MNYIYVIINVINKKQYIGSTSNYSRRKNGHLWQLRLKKHHSYRLQKDYNEYGKEAFVFSILERVEDKNSLIEREQYYIDTLQPEYNILKVALENYAHTRSKRVYKYTSTGDLVCIYSSCKEATKKEEGTNTDALSAACRGEIRGYKGFIWLYEKDLDQLETRIANFTYTVTEETREKMRKKKLGIKQSAETCLNKSRASKGKMPKSLPKLLELKFKRPVYIYDIEDNFIAYYESIKNCAKDYSGAGWQLYNAKEDIVIPSNRSKCKGLKFSFKKIN